jgi:adenylylsulfate kinase-like enzyme
MHATRDTVGLDGHYAVVADLVVLVGPVGAGKSTVAGRLAQLVRQNSMTAADVDMDDVAFMQCGGDDLDEFWRRAAVATAGLVRAWFDAGVDVVITHGAFFESDGFEILRLRAATSRSTTSCSASTPRSP